MPARRGTGRRGSCSEGGGYAFPMVDLEEHTLEQVGDRCEECGAKLTDQELRAALENGTPALCSVHAAETLTLDPDESEASG